MEMEGPQHPKHRPDLRHIAHMEGKIVPVTNVPSLERSNQT